MQSILLIRYSALGDVVLATSVIGPLREKYPGVRIDWVTDAAYAALLEGVPDRVISFRRKDSASRAAVVREVRGRYDLVIDLQNKWWSRRVASVAAPQRLRLVLRTPGQALLSLFGRDVVLNQVSAAQLYAQAAQVDGGGCPSLRVNDENQAEAERLLPGRGWVAVAPGASKETKRWPAARLGQVAAALKAQGHRVALVGGPMDGELLEEVRQVCPVDADLSQQSLTVVAAGLARVDLLIGNDSGLVHITGAVGRPALALFGPTSVTRWGPAPPGRALSLGLPCSPCSNHGGQKCPLGHHRCLQDLEVSAVLSAAAQLLTR